MMKKYIAPVMDVMEMEAANLLTGSAGTNSVSNDLGNNPPSTPSFHAREFTVWGAGDEE